MARLARSLAGAMALAAWLAWPGPLRAAEPDAAAKPGTVSTQATARERVPNTIADVVLGVSARGRSLAEVQRTLSGTSTRLIAYLGTAGAERTRTETVELGPEIDPNPPRGQPARVLGYTGSVRVSFRIEATRLGIVLGEALGQGANTIEQTEFGPREAELDATRQRLGAAATRIALDQARAMAEAAGRHIGAIRSLSLEGEANQRPRPMMAARMAEPSRSPAPIATQAGESELTATVTLVATLIEP